jgi:hypothetical protein
MSTQGSDRRQQAESSVLFQQGMTCALILLIVGILVYGLHAPSAASSPATLSAKRFACPYAEAIRPSGWTGGVNGTTFLFASPDGSAQALLYALRDKAWELAAIDANPAALGPVVETALGAAGLTLSGLAFANLQTDQPFHNFTALRFSFSAGARQGIGVLFYSGDVRFLYLGIWTPGNEDEERRAIACLDHVALVPPYDGALFQRPVTDTRLPVDLVQGLSEAESRLTEARTALDAGQHDMLSLQRAMSGLEAAMKRVAVAQAYCAEFPQAAELVAAARECRRLRELRMNQMKGQVLQYRAMGNTTAARSIAHDLIVACSLDGDLRVKAWAERQYQNLSPQE